MKLIPLTQGLSTQVSDEDYEHLMQWKWCAMKRPDGSYLAVRGSRKDEEHCIVYMHRVIVNAKSNEMVDHADHNTLNNERYNLRACTHSENMYNLHISTRNKSGFKGVFWCKYKKKWRTAIRKNNKCIHIGFFALKEDAARAYDRKARELHGKFACVNFPENGERGCRN